MEQFIEKQIKNSDKYKADKIRQRIFKRLFEKEKQRDQVILDKLLCATEADTK